MNPTIIAFCCLQSWGNLYTIYITWFYFRLHQKVPDPLDFFTDYAQKADLILQNNGLFDRPFVEKAAVYTGNLEKTPRGIPNLSGNFIIEPRSAILQSYPGY